jgi:hypothetical protein
VWANHEFSWKGYQSQTAIFNDPPEPAQTLKIAASQAWYEYQPAEFGFSSLAVAARDERGSDSAGATASAASTWRRLKLASAGVISDGCGSRQTLGFRFIMLDAGTRFFGSW